MKFMFCRENVNRMYLLTNMVIGALASIILMYFCLQIYGVADRGEMVAIQAAIALLSSLTRFGMHQATLSMKSDQGEMKFMINEILSTFMSVIVYQALVCASILILIISSLEVIYIKTYDVPSLIVAIYLLVFFLHSNLYFIASMFLDPKIILLSTLLTWTIIFLFLTINHGDSIRNVFLAYIFGFSFASLIMFAKAKLKLQLKPNLLIVRLLFSRGIKIYMWQNLKDINYRVDLIILPIFMKPSEFGIYTVILNLSQSSWRIIDPLLSIYQREFMIKNVKIAKSNYFRIFLFLVVFGVIFGVLVYEVASLMTGVSLNEYYPHIIFFSLGLVLFSLWKIVAVQLVVLGKNGFNFFTQLIFLILLLNATLRVNELGEALWSIGICYICMSVLATFYGKIRR